MAGQSGVCAMSKITASSDLSNIKAEEMQRFTTIFAQDVAQTINGKLDFANNFACKVMGGINFPVLNTPVAVTHNLGRVTSSFIVISKDQTCDIFVSQTSAPTSSVLYLESNVSGATVSVVVL